MLHLRRAQGVVQVGHVHAEQLEEGAPEYPKPCWIPLDFLSPGGSVGINAIGSVKVGVE